MSIWTKVLKAEMELSDDKETIDIFVGSDDCGNNYLEIKVSDIKELMKDI